MTRAGTLHGYKIPYKQLYSTNLQSPYSLLSTTSTMDMKTDTGSEMMKKMLEIRLGQGTRREKYIWSRKVWWLYRKERLIGKGGFGTDGFRVAIKEVIKNPAIDKEDNDILLQQVKDIPRVI